MDIIYSFWKSGHIYEQSLVKNDQVTSEVSDGNTEIIEKPGEDGRCSLDLEVGDETHCQEQSDIEFASVRKSPEVTQKAALTAKSFGNFLYSMANKAGRHISETAKQVKHTIEENTILSDFNREQEMFVRSRSSTKESRSAPWVGCVDEASVKQQILSLAADKRNFVRSPPAAVQFEFNFEEMHPVAEAALIEDKNLQGMRFDLVPKLVNEETFWRNYFYRVSLIKQSVQLASPGLERVTSVDPSSDNTSDRSTKGEEDWEKELQKELQEYEVVADSTEAHTDWEKEIAEMLGTEGSEAVTT